MSREEKDAHCDHVFNMRALSVCGMQCTAAIVACDRMLDDPAMDALESRDVERITAAVAHSIIVWVFG